MKTASQFLDDLRAHFGASSDRQLTRFTGWLPQQTTRYRSGKNTFDDETAVKVAVWLDIDPAYVMMCMAAQRAATPAVRDAWEHMLKKVSAGVLIALGAMGGPMPAESQAAPNRLLHKQNYEHRTADLHIMRTRRRRSWFARVAGSAYALATQI